MAKCQCTYSYPEEWLPVPGYEGLYEVSNHGQVWSCGRKVLQKNGRIYNRKPGMLKARAGQKYASVMLYNNDGVTKTFRIHRLVVTAFLGVIPDDLEVRHWDDQPRNNHLSNLLLGDRSDNMRDAVRNGLHPEASKTVCVNGHEFTRENTILIDKPNGRSRRYCRKCTQDSRAKIHRKSQEKVDAGYHAPKRFGGTCHKGHPFDEENTYFYANGNRECKTCRRVRDKIRRRK